MVNELESVRPAPHAYFSRHEDTSRAEAGNVEARNWKPPLLAAIIVVLGLIAIGSLYPTRSATRELLTQSGVHCVAYRDALTCNWLEFTRGKARAEQLAQERRRLRGPEPPP